MHALMLSCSSNAAAEMTHTHTYTHTHTHMIRQGIIISEELIPASNTLFCMYVFVQLPAQII